MKLLLVQTGFIGDVILTIPVIRELQKLYPAAQIDLLTTPLAAPLFEGFPGLGQVIVYDKRRRDRGFRGFIRTVRRLSQVGYTTAFCVHRSLRTAALVLAARIPSRFGFREAAGRWMYSRTATRREYAHDVLRNLAILKNVGQSPKAESAELFLPISAQMQGRVNAIAGEKMGLRVGVAPGSVWATKRWHVDGFIEVIRGLTQKDLQVVLLGGPEDFEIGRQLEQVSPKTVNTIGRTSLLESAAIIESCDVVITNDSAPLHLASATKTPVVAIFCATVPEFGFGPWDVPNEIVQVEGLACRPCARHGGKQCPIRTLECQNRIEPLRVIGAVERLLNNAHNSRSHDTSSTADAR